MRNAWRKRGRRAAATSNNEHEVLPNLEGLGLTRDVMDTIKSVARTLGPLSSYTSLSQLFKYWHIASKIKNDILAVYPSNQPTDVTPTLIHATFSVLQQIYMTTRSRQFGML